MNKSSRLFSAVLLCGLIFSACSTPPASTQPAQAEEATAVQSNATAAPDATAAATEPAVVESEASAIQHASVPGSPAMSGGKKWGDHSSVSSTNKARAQLGDDFSDGRFERPYNANTMDVYFPHLDIDHAVIHAEDALWVYAIISMVGRDANNAFTGQYALELDLDQDGFGEFLIMVDNPSATEWTTDGVHVYTDANSDIGGVKPFKADSDGASSDGYESVLFDQGNGNDADLAWVRLDSTNPNSFQIAYKQDLLAGEKTYTAGLWAATHLDPGLFDYSDHFTYEQAGAGNPEVANFYPIKGLSELDNSCRQAIGYDATGLEPGIC